MIVVRSLQYVDVLFLRSVDPDYQPRKSITLNRFRFVFRQVEDNLKLDGRSDSLNRYTITLYRRNLSLRDMNFPFTDTIYFYYIKFPFYRHRIQTIESNFRSTDTDFDLLDMKGYLGNALFPPTIRNFRSTDTGFSLTDLN